METNRLSVLVALSLASGAAMEAQAQSSIEVYGLVGAYAGRMQRSGDAAAATQVNGGGLTTSFIGFRGKEDLGGDLRAVYSLESFFRPDTGEQGRSTADPLFSRNAWVGLEGNWGRLSLGRQTNPAYAAMLQLSPFGTSVVFSPLVLQTFVATYGSNVLGDTVWNNVIQYATPTVNGFRGTVQYGPGEVAGKSGVANLGLHGTYSSGAFVASLSAQRLRVNVLTPVAAEQRVVLGGASYDFGVLRLYGNGSRTLIDGGRSTRTGDIGVSVPVSQAGSLMAEIARSRIDAPRVADTFRTTSSFGYDYRLSKRTDVYAVYSRDKRSGAASAGSQAIGLRHMF
ncbi:porin [Oxalobacteraceae bacterium A2-2]